MNATVPLTGTSPRARRTHDRDNDDIHVHTRVTARARARTQRNGATEASCYNVRTYVASAAIIAAMLARRTCESENENERADAQTRVGVSPDRARILFPRSREYRGENAEIRGSCNKRIMWEYSRGDDRYEETRWASAG